MSYFFSIKKLNKIIFSFLIIFSFFQVCNDSFAGTKEEEQKKIEETAKKKKEKEDKEKKDAEEQEAQEKKEKEDKVKKAREDAENKKIDTRIDLKIQIIIIGLILSLLINLIFILFYFFISKRKVQDSINKLKIISKKHHNINEVNTNSFGNIEKHISFFNQGIIDLNNKINIINKNINSIQNSSIESTKNKVESLREKNFKASNFQEEEIREPIDPIIDATRKHFDLTNREFIKKYPNSIKLDITNADDVVYRSSEPVFNESEQGKYIAISFPTIDNSKYYLFFAKGTNITSEDVIAPKTVFKLDKDPEIGKIYDDWEIIEPAILIMNNNNWQISKKGKIEL